MALVFIIYVLDSNSTLIFKLYLHMIINMKKTKAGKSKSGEYNSKDIPARVPFRQGLASLTRLVAYSGIVGCSAVKLKKLHEWIDTRNYGYG